MRWTRHIEELILSSFSPRPLDTGRLRGVCDERTIGYPSSLIPHPDTCCEALTGPPAWSRQARLLALLGKTADPRDLAGVHTPVPPWWRPLL